MKRTPQPWVGLALAASLLLSGCATGWRAAWRPATGAAKQADFERREQALEQRARAHAHYAAGVAYDLNGQGEAAEKEFWASVWADPANEPLALELTRRLLQRQRADRAAELLTRCAALPGASGLVHAWLALAQAQSGRLDPAIASARAAIKKAPQLALGYQTLTQIYLDKKQPQEALKVMDEALRQPAAPAEFLVDVAETIAGAARNKTVALEEAKPRVQAALSRAAQHKPAQPLLLQKMAESYKTIGDLARAAELYQQLLKEHPPANPALLPVLREQLLQLYLRSGDKARAAEQLREIVRDNPGNAQAHYLLGNLAAEAKQYDEAASALTKVLLFNPDFEPAYYELAGVQLMNNQPQEALDTLNKARARFQVGFLLEYYAGLAHAALKQYAEAVKNYISAEVHAKTSEPTRLNHIFYFQLGAACERRSDYAEAEKQFRKCLQLSPDYAEALNYLGYMWAERGVNLEEARTMIEKAVKLEPKNAAYLDSLGWVLFKLKRTEEALGYQEQAMALAEKPDPTLYDHLGDIYAALGRINEARAAWQKALALEPTEELKKKLAEHAPSAPSP